MQSSGALVSVLVTVPMLFGCAARKELCGSTAPCPSGTTCQGGMCEGPISSPLGSRRVVVGPASLAVLRREASPPAVPPPPVFTLGRASDETKLLLRFDLEKLDSSATVVRASIVLDRSDALVHDPTPLALHAERVISRWDEQRVSWSTVPAIQDVGAPRTVIEPFGPRQVRIDVTDLARRWLQHDAADQGAVLVTENSTPTGYAFALGSTLLPLPDPRSIFDLDRPLPPRLELYVR